jgi:tetratricopeptide (TPR) repeat protein
MELTREDFDRQNAAHKVFFEMAAQYLDEGQDELAIDAFRQAIKSSKDLLLNNAICYFHIGRIYYDNDQPKEALEAFEMAVPYAKHFPECSYIILIYRRLAHLYFYDEENYEESKKYYTKIFEIDPNSMEMYLKIKDCDDEIERARLRSEAFVDFEFKRFLMEISVLNEPGLYIVNVFDINDDSIINHEKGVFIFHENEVILETRDGSNDFIAFTSDGKGLNVKYVVMNGHVIVDQSCSRIEIIRGANKVLDFVVDQS